MTTTAHLLTQNSGRVAALHASSSSAADTVPIANGGGKIDSWVSDATTSEPGKVTLAANGGTTAGTAVQANDDRLNGLTVIAGTTALAVLCGAGTMGAVTFDGTTAVTGWTLVARVYTCNTAMCFDYSAVTFATAGGNIGLVTKGSPLKATSGTITGSGTVTISWDGSDASGNTAGAGAAKLSNAMLLGGTTGGIGRNGSGVGGAATNQANGACMGSAGGAGGTAVGTGAGGAAGTITLAWAEGSYLGDAARLLTLLYATTMGASAPTFLGLSGGSGGGGGAASAGLGGGGGGGGGVVAVYFSQFNAGTGTLIVRGNGGIGGLGAASGTSTAAGGGGGGAGSVLVVFGFLTGTVQLAAAGGNAGNAAVGNTATNSANGGSGGSGGFILCLYGALADGTSPPTTSVVGGTAGTGAGTAGVAGSAGTAGTAYVVQA